ncbi:unnamed protein product [Cladocopium goreaui]|uniref:Uncharacterized protein n=1 Tax=Cladocopium goreaui TaxID=2562237 RepID=A0A9P1CQ72_9DINO|nr:unnamed protein product [Cladocopium goreaui]
MAVEKFAGVKRIHTAFKNRGHASASYEINDDPVFQDYNSGLGFAYCLALTIRLFKKVGLNFEAPVCSTWVWLSRGNLLETVWILIDHKSITPAKPRNLMVSRMCINLLVMCILRLCFVVEQPGSSILEEHPLFVWLCRHFRIYKAFIWMGSYGGCRDLA